MCSIYLHFVQYTKYRLKRVKLDPQMQIHISLRMSLARRFQL